MLNNEMLWLLFIFNKKSSIFIYLPEHPRDNGDNRLRNSRNENAVIVQHLRTDWLQGSQAERLLARYADVRVHECL